MGRGGQWAACVVVVMATLAPCIARAQPSFSYRTTLDVCPSSERAHARLAAALRTTPGGAMPSIDATLVLDADAGGYVARVSLREGDYEEQRELHGQDCALLADAAMLVIAIALSPGLTSLDAPVTQPPPTTSTTPTPTTTPTLRGSLWLAARVAYGVLPGVSVGGELGGTLAFDALRLDAAVRGLPFGAARVGAASLLGGDLSQLVGLVRARGVGTVVEHLELGAGGGVEAGVVLGHGVGISDPRDASAPWVALEGAASLSWVPWPIIAFFFEIEALVPIVRPVFTVAGLGVVYRPEPVAGALRLGVEVRIP